MREIKNLSGFAFISVFPQNQFKVTSPIHTSVFNDFILVVMVPGGEYKVFNETEYVDVEWVVWTLVNFKLGNFV